MYARDCSTHRAHAKLPALTFAEFGEGIADSQGIVFIRS